MSATVESVDKALALLLLLGERGTVSVTESARAIGVAPSTAHRLLGTLVRRGFVQQDAQTKHYAPGPALLELGLAAVRGLDIRRLARPALERLVCEIGETAHLAALQGQDVLFLDSVESAKALRVTNRTGMTLPAHSTAAGNALLAALSIDGLRAIFSDEQLPSGRARAFRLRRDLEQALDVVRERGYATNFDESEPGVSAVAAAIVDRMGRPVAALTVSAPLSRLDASQVAEIGAAVILATRAVAASLP